MDKTLQVDMTWLTLVVGAIIPVLTGAVVKWKASSATKAYTNLALSAIGGALVTVVANKGALQLKEFVATIITTLVVSWGSYEGFYKKTGITDKVQMATADLGIGSVPPTPVEPEPPFDMDEVEAVRRIVAEMATIKKSYREAHPDFTPAG